MPNVARLVPQSPRPLDWPAINARLAHEVAIGIRMDGRLNDESLSVAWLFQNLTTDARNRMLAALVGEPCMCLRCVWTREQDPRPGPAA
jgi:hypothetical protein